MLQFGDTSTLVGYLCHVPKNGRKGIKQIVEKSKGGDRGTWGKVNYSGEK